MLRITAKILVAAALLAAVPVLPAHAGYRDLIIDGCREDERVDGTYSQKDYRDALDNLSDDQLQYTDCEAILRAAQLAAARAQAGGGNAGIPAIDNLIAGAGGDPLATASPQERAAVGTEVKRAGQTGGDEIRVGGELVDPSSLGAGRIVAASASDLPAPLLAALALAGLAALVLFGFSIAPRIRSRRGA